MGGEWAARRAGAALAIMEMERRMALTAARFRESACLQDGGKKR